MSDPIDKLTSLGDALEGAPMPLPPSEIRARGDRIRRRKHALVAGASAAVVAAVAVPVVAFTIGGDDDKPEDFTPQPTISDSVAPAALSPENLLTDEDAIYPNGRSDWREADTFPGDGQAGFNPCARQSLAGLGAASVFQRTFDFVSTDTDAVEPSLTFNEAIAEFPTSDDARAALDTITGWYDSCLPTGADRFDTGQGTPVETDVDAEAEYVPASYGPVDESLDPFGYEVWFLDSGFVLAGDRIAVLTQITHGQDNNWEAGESPVELMLPVAAERLVLGNGGTVDETPTDGADWPTTLGDFPLTSGWPEIDGNNDYQLDAPSADNEAMVAAGDLVGCQDISTGEVADRLTARLTWGENYRIREIQLFADDEAAMAYLDSVQDAYAVCEAEGPSDTVPSFTTEVGDGAIGEDSTVITVASDGIGRQVINVVRVGNAVTVDLASDEGQGDTVMDLATETRENLADVVGAMYGLRIGANSVDPDLTDPAALTTIPDDFPIDLILNAPEFDDPDQTVDGPAPDADGARGLTMCGTELSFPNSDNADPAHEMSTSVSTLEGYDGRTIHAYPTAQDAVERMTLLRSEIQGCTRDAGGDGISDRLFEIYNNDTGYEGVTFGWYYEATEFQPAGAGQIYTVLRVGNAVVTITWSSEWGVEAMEDAVPRQVDLAQELGSEMCVFSVAGC